MANTIPLQSTQSADEVTKAGEKYYFDILKEKLEKTNNGQFLVLEVESKKYFINEDLMVALNQAQKEFPSKLFLLFK